MHAFDRQTQRRTDTDGRTEYTCILIVRPRLHSMQRGNESQVTMPVYVRENTNVLRRCMKTASDGVVL